LAVARLCRRAERRANARTRRTAVRKAAACVAAVTVVGRIGQRCEPSTATK